MRVFHDWEFEEKSGVIDPISVGMVREDGRELYIVFNDFDTLSVARNRWLMKNVMSSIGHHETTGYQIGTGGPVKDIIVIDDDAMTKADARIEILEFVDDITPEWWAWYGAYDHVALCGLFGSMVDLPDGWPMITMDLKQMHKTAGMPAMPQQPAGKHNALDDARFNVERYRFLINRIEPTVWVIAESKSQARDWIDSTYFDDSKIIVITYAGQLQGANMSPKDVVVPLVPLTNEMIEYIKFARRLP